MSTRHKTALVAAILTLWVLGVSAHKFYLMRMYTHLPLWAVMLLSLPAGLILGLVWRIRWFAAHDWEVALRWFAVPLFILAVFFSQYLGRRTGDHFFLIYLYGASRVEAGQFQLVSAGKGQPLLVMSGDREIDRITDAGVRDYIRGAVEATVLCSAFFLMLKTRSGKGFESRFIWIRF